MKEYSREEQYRILLSSTDRLTWRVKHMLITQFQCAENVFLNLENSIAQLVSPAALQALRSLKQTGFETILTQMQRSGTEVVFYENPSYPVLLREIPDPPDLLFVRGILGKEARSVAIFGSRRDTRYGRTQAYGIAREMASNGVTIVSGLAR